VDAPGGALDLLTHPVVRTVAETGSTNTDLLALARAGAAEGIWLRAERQLAGRGRQGRDWASPPGNLYASTLVRLRAPDPPAATLALVAGVAVQEAVAAYLPAGPAAPRIKWPNDLLVGGAKLSGVLLEREGDAVVCGLGVNLTSHPDLPGRPATDLATLGATVAAADLLPTLADAFARWLARWRGEGLAAVAACWSERAHPRGTALGVRLPDGTELDGLFEGLAPDGALNLRLAGGDRRVIHAADVFLI